MAVLRNISADRLGFGRRGHLTSPKKWLLPYEKAASLESIGLGANSVFNGESHLNLHRPAVARNIG